MNLNQRINKLKEIDAKIELTLKQEQMIQLVVDYLAIKQRVLTTYFHADTEIMDGDIKAYEEKRRVIQKFVINMPF